MDPAASNPAAPAAPAAPVAAPAPQAPAAPANPAAGVQQGASGPQAPSLNQAAADDDNEWAAATKNQYPDYKQDGNNEQPKPKENGQRPQTDPKNPAKKEGDAGAGDGNGAENEGAPDLSENEPKDPATAEREARAAARQSRQHLEAVTNDVREKLYPDLKPHLTDADGDPIKTIDDVMKLINPLTRTVENPNGRLFTEEEAGQWLLSAQQQFNQNLAKTEQEITRVSELQVDIKVQSDYITKKYADQLKDPQLRQAIWAKFEQTLTKDPKTGIITNMPVPLEDFYELALEGRAAATPAPAAPVVPGQPAAPAAPAKTEQEQQAEAQRQRQQSRADRSDIYAPPANPKLDADEDEWETARKDYYGPEYKGK